MRNALIAAAALVATATVAHATTVSDPVGDFLQTFTGSHDPDLDVTSFGVSYDSATSEFTIDATLAGLIDPSKAGSYVIGVNTGTGRGPFAGIGEPNVIFNQAIVIQKTGAGAVGANALTATISGDSFSLLVPVAFLPTTGFAPDQYGFNLWPRSGAGNSLISDFAPDNSTITAVPEPAAWALMLSGFGLTGAVIRRARRTKLTLARPA